MLSAINATILDYEGIQYTREFYSPVYETPEQLASRLPDYRNTLYWSADVMKGKQGKNEIVFYTSDKKGEYVVIVEGMNSRGKMGTTMMRFLVK